jgi:hypothetical protein
MIAMICHWLTIAQDLRAYRFTDEDGMAAEVNLLCDSDLQALVRESGWKYVLRTSKTSTLTWQGEEFRFTDVMEHVAPGDVFEVPGAFFTQRGYGPVLAVTWWRKDCKEPIPSRLEHDLG